MTRDEARRRAVEAVQQTEAHHAAVQAMYDAFNIRHVQPMYVVAAIYLAAMANAGWRMARDVPAAYQDGPSDLLARGWNACRAAMLGDE